jgi:cytochrome b6-f complex iron-sulfur subunit
VAGVCSFFKAILGKCETKPLSPELWSVEGGKVVVKLSQKPDAIPKGGAAYLQGKGLQEPLLIVHTDDDKYLSFTNRCPHMKRKIDPVAGEAKLRCCSVFHSKFDYDGKPLSGPAKESLKRHQVELSQGNLVLTV